MTDFDTIGIIHALAFDSNAGIVLLNHAVALESGIAPAQIADRIRDGRLSESAKVKALFMLKYLVDHPDLTSALAENAKRKEGKS